MEPARAGMRLKAFALDYLLILGYLVALSVVGTALTLGPLGDRWSSLFSTPLRADLCAFVLSVLPVVAYFAHAESSRSGATWGKRRMGLKVLGADGAPLGIGRSLSRSALKFLPWQIAHTSMLHILGFPLSPGEPPLGSIVGLVLVWVLVASYLSGLSTLCGGRTPYDRLAGTVVVHAPAGPAAE